MNRIRRAGNSVRTTSALLFALGDLRSGYQGESTRSDHEQSGDHFEYFPRQTNGIERRGLREV